MRKPPSWLRHTLLCLFLAACGGESVDETPAKPAAVPAPDPVRNLLLICLDTVRGDAYYRLAKEQPDALARWEAEGVVYSQADSTAPWTVPALGSVFSGLWPAQHGAGALPGLERVSIAENRPGAMHREARTFTRKARRKGFATIAISASGWTINSANGGGIVRGFEEFHNYAPTLKNLGDAYWKPMIEQWETLLAARSEQDRAIHLLHFMEAHNWHVVPEPELDDRIAQLPPGQLALYRNMAPERACADQQSLNCKRYIVYLIAIAELRDVVAGMLDSLQAKGLLDDTAVVLFSDHGEEFSDREGEPRPALGSSTEPYFGHGQSLYQELLHIPLVVWHPALGGRVVDAPVSLVDIAPSAARWLGMAFEPDHWQGRYLDNFNGLAADAQERVLYASNISRGEKQTSSRQGSHKAIWYMASDEMVYYDLASDPLELQALNDNALVMQFDRHFLDHDQLKVERKTESTALSSEQLKRLQSIGYLQGVDSTDEAE